MIEIIQLSAKMYFSVAIQVNNRFSLILWDANKAYEPRVIVKNIVFESLNIQAGSDKTRVSTEMLSLNSTIRIFYRNPVTFFGVHITSNPLELHYYQLKVASGQIGNFYQARKTHRTARTVVQVVKEDQQRVVKPLNLTFLVRSRAYILGKLVKSKFYERIRCSITLRGSTLGKHSNMTDYCVYD